MSKVYEEYKNIAEDYHESKYQAWREDIEKYTLCKHIDKNCKNILEMACGTGFYTKILSEMGYQVNAFDIVPEMIEKAKEYFPDGNFFVADACSKICYGEYDCVFAAYLLNYCYNIEMLKNMITTIYKNLKEGGKFITVNNDAEQDINTYELTERYGFTKKYIEMEPYSKVEYHFPSFVITNYKCPSQTLREIFIEVGFKEINILPLLIKENTKVNYEIFLEIKPIMIIEAIK